MEHTGERRPYVAAVVPAAGLSTRMRGLDKQFEELCGVPVLARTMLALAQSDWIDELVVVARRADTADVLALARQWGVAKLRSVVAGGETRQQSVLRGLEAVSPQAAYVAIHDGARPLVSQQVIARAVLDALGCGAAAAAVPVVDTLKLADGEGCICRTVDRSRLFAVQTPQVFALGRYLSAARQALSQGLDYTDDCQMLEAVGERVKLSVGDPRNLKITTPEDLAVARAILEQEEPVL